MLPDRAAHGVPQEADVGRVMNVGPGNEGVTAPAQGRGPGFFPATGWPLPPTGRLTLTGSFGLRWPTLSTSVR